MMKYISHNVLRWIVLLLIQCQCINIYGSFDNYIDSLLTVNRMEFATIRDSLYITNPEYRDKDFLIWGKDTKSGYVVIACDSVYSTYLITKENDEWQYTKIDPFDTERFDPEFPPYKDGTPGEEADFKNNPPNKLSFPDSLPKYIETSFFTETQPFYFAIYYANNKLIDFTMSLMPGSELIPNNLALYIIAIWCSQWNYPYFKEMKKKR